ncbi:MAG: hypothetical protein KBA26_04920 [Candidatus Delongbacteria bacterium]|nr:hypothetical protein [Candidatus Delongbacteria bacterium]
MKVIASCRLLWIIMLLMMTAVEGSASRQVRLQVISSQSSQGACYVRIYYTPADTGINTGKPDLFKDKPWREMELTQNPMMITDLPAGDYYWYAWQDQTPNRQVDFDPPEPTGWYCRRFGSMQGLTIDQTDDQLHDVSIKLYAPTPFPKENVEKGNGRLLRKKGMTVLQVWGTPEQMGWAHGALIGQQILDFFRFYIIEYQVGSIDEYRDKTVPMLEERYNPEEEFQKEFTAIIQGMRDQGLNLYITELGRDFNTTDLLAINAYGELYMTNLACTQAAFWGEMTSGSTLKGGLITARNMDGETDLRKTTVMHFLITAFSPSGKTAWVSFKWPGFIGTYSGISRNGLYCMLNYGTKEPGPVTTRHTPVTLGIRRILEEGDPMNLLESSQKIISRYCCTGGGMCGAPSVILMAGPYYGQSVPALFYEGTRFGWSYRLPGEAPNFSPYSVIGSNHFFKYGVNPAKPDLVFGSEPYYSSRWRASVAFNKATVWERTHRPVDTAEMIDFLQSVGHRYSEHSIIYRANERKVLVANDDLKFDYWDGPFMPWIEFQLDDFFQP